MPTTKKRPPEHPALASAKRAIRRALPHLTPVQLVRVAATTELLAYGEDRGRWSLSTQWAEEFPPQPYQIGAKAGVR
jgi:hypothetical protein